MKARVAGWVTGETGPVEVELRTSRGAPRALTDADGRFSFESVVRGLARFVFTPRGDGRPVITPAVEI